MCGGAQINVALETHRTCRLSLFCPPLHSPAVHSTVQWIMGFLSEDGVQQVVICQILYAFWMLEYNRTKTLSSLSVRPTKLLCLQRERHSPAEQKHVKPAGCMARVPQRVALQPRYKPAL